MKRTTLFIIAAAVLGVALVIYVATSDSTPHTGDVVGTIGAAEEDPIPGVERAERYRTPQIGDEAVTLDNPEIQELLQDDQVLRVVQDPAFQRAMSSEPMRRGLLSEELQRALLQAEFGRALSEVQAQQIDATAMSRTQLETFANRVFDTQLARLIVEQEDLGRALFAYPELARAISASPELGRALLANQDLQRLFSSVDAISAMSDLQRQGIYATAGFQRFISAPAAMGLLRNASAFDAFLGRAASIDAVSTY